jgi:hypothetical protein
VARIRAIREQVETKEKLLEDRSEATDLIELGKALNEKLTAIEEAIHNPHAEVAYDVLAGRHGGAQLYSRYSHLNESSRDHDGPPTQGMLEVAQDLDAELAEQKNDLDEIVSSGVQQYAQAAQELAIGHVIVPQ